MQVPIRKAGEYSDLSLDPKMTEAKFLELKTDLQKLKEVHRPKWIKEMRIAASDGDFSENASYQIAKAKLRGVNQKITDLEKLLAKVEIIHLDTNKSVVQVGSVVTVENEDKQSTYQILGSVETNPAQGIISLHSPLGQALLGQILGKIVLVNGREYKIVKIT